MKRLIFILIFLFIFIWIGIYLQRLNYLIIGFGKWEIETTLWTAFLILVLVYLMVRLFSNLYQFPRRWSHYKKHRKIYNLDRALQHALKAEMMGDEMEAEKNFSKAAKLNPKATVYTFKAALVQPKALLKKEQYEQKNLQSENETLLSSFVKAQLEFDQGWYEESLKTVESARKKFLDHPKLLALAFKSHYQLSHWNECVNLLKKATDLKIFPLPEEAVMLKCYKNHLKENLETSGSEIWKNIPELYRYQDEIIDLYANYLIRPSPLPKKNSVELIKLIQEGYSPAILAYAKIQDKNPEQQINLLQKTTREKGESAELYFSMAEIYAHHKILGKAIEAYEKSISLKPRPLAYQKLGELYEANGKYEKACFYYRQACQT